MSTPELTDPTRTHTEEPGGDAPGRLDGAAALVPGLFVASLVAAGLIAADAGSGAAEAALVWLYVAWVYALGFAACGVLARALAFALGRDPALALSVAAASAWAATNYVVVWGAGRTFSNAELSALLVTVVALIAAGAAAAARALLARWASGPIARAAAWALTAALWGGMLWHNREGFAQLDPASIALGLLVLALTSAGRWARGRWPARVNRPLLGAGAALVVASAATFVGVEATNHGAASAAAEFGPVTRYVAAATQRVTDFDGDGHSSLMGGGDCAPFDATISPDARDVPDDGIDNNCIGGDATSLANIPAPRPHPLPPGWPERMNVVVVSVEALRPDHVHALGYDRETSPNLDALIAQGVVFERFYASSTYTRLSLPSLWTARAPARIAWEAQEKTKMPRIARENPWVPERFQRAGFTTLALQTDFPAFNDKDHIGFDRGFTRYDAGFKLAYRGGTMRGFPSIPQTDRAIELIEEHADTPFMLWVHMVEPHYKYERFPGAPDFGSDRVGLYDAEIWGVDQQIGRIVEALKANGLWEETIVFVTGDHGEEFEEHGKRYHGSNLHEPQIRTLGLLRVPGVGARRVAEPVGFTDVGATLLNLAGVTKTFEGFQGRNLTAALIEDAPITPATIVAEVWRVTSRRGYQLATIAWPYKLIMSGKGGKKRELFDLSKDPGERKNLWKRSGLADVKGDMFSQATSHLNASDRTYEAPQKKTTKEPTKKAPAKKSPTKKTPRKE
jgi:arylsulfatase A-like enzyme